MNCSACGHALDPRLPSNEKAHVEEPFLGDRSKLRGNTAAKLRRAAMELCGCRLCALALNPPKTFDEAWRVCSPNHGRARFPAEFTTEEFTWGKK